jgi:hypothetical protein
MLRWRSNARRRRCRRRASFSCRGQVQSHSAHVAFSVHVRYRWHAYFARELSVLYRETRRGESVYVCLMPDGTGSVVPEWMFDAAECLRHDLGPPRASIDALLDLRALLLAIASDPELSVALLPPQEDRHALKTTGKTGKLVHATTAGIDEPGRASRRGEEKRGRRTSRKTAVAARAGAGKCGGER